MENLKIYLDKDIDTNLIKSKKIAIIGFGSQGYGQSTCLKDSGCDVVLGLRLGGKSDVKAKDCGFNTMPIEDIKALGTVIKDISADDCILFLWVTFPKLEEAIETIKSWGFTYKTLAFSWIKTNPKDGQPFFGIGYYTRSNCEVCLLATKGKARKLVISNKESSCIISEIQEHSKKPDEARQRIDELVGQVPKIELFARQQVDGWDAWGNEI